jgi:hypothetical protein
MTNQLTLTALRASAAELTRELERMPETATTWKPAETEWAQVECLLHLQLVERHIFLPRLTRIVKEDNPPLPVVDETALFAEARALNRSRADLLRDFLADRAAEIALLENADWSRPGTHAARGPITLGWVADYALGHTYEHLSQMMRVRLSYETKK